MAATNTIAGILGSIKTTIEALDPAGDDLSARSAYKQAPDGRTDAQLAVGDMDREFRLGAIIPTDVDLMFPTCSEVQFDGNFELSIWHIKTGNITSGRDRLAADVHQIAMALQKKTGANWPDGVALIELVGGRSAETERGWKTDLNFRIIYQMTEV